MKLPVSIRTVKVPQSKPGVQVFYPVIEQLANPHVQYTINHKIIDTLNRLLIEQHYNDPNLVELIAYFEIKNNQRNILSLNLIVYSFTGGAHGMTIVQSLTFDTKSGQLFQLSDLFKVGSPYVEKISAIIKEDIKNWDVVVLDPFVQIKADQDFYIADTSLVIYFQLYELSPYSSGFPYFPIAILDLQSIIRDKGPLDTMMAFT